MTRMLKISLELDGINDGENKAFVNALLEYKKPNEHTIIHMVKEMIKKAEAECVLNAITS
jgi:hypothetical protein